MSDCQHKQLILTSGRGTDGFPIYRCSLECGALFKVKPEEITVTNHDEVQRAASEE